MKNKNNALYLLGLAFLLIGLANKIDAMDKEDYNSTPACWDNEESLPCPLSPVWSDGENDASFLPSVDPVNAQTRRALNASNFSRTNQPSRRTGRPAYCQELTLYLFGEGVHCQYCGNFFSPRSDYLRHIADYHPSLSQSRRKRVKNDSMEAVNSSRMKVSFLCDHR